MNIGDVREEETVAEREEKMVFVVLSDQSRPLRST